MPNAPTGLSYTQLWRDLKRYLRSEIAASRVGPRSDALISVLDYMTTEENIQRPLSREQQHWLAQFDNPVYRIEHNGSFLLTSGYGMHRSTAVGLVRRGICEFVAPSPRGSWAIRKLADG